MRILVLTNLYPPHAVGGYEIGCRDATEALRARGHEVLVLTSTSGCQGAGGCVEGHVHRRLVLAQDPGTNALGFVRQLVRTEVRNARILRELCHALQPDIVYVWNLLWLSRRLLHCLPERYPVASYVFDHSLVRWRQDDPWYWYWNHPGTAGASHVLKRLGQAALRPVGLRTSYDLPARLHCQFASRFLRDQAAAHGVTVGAGGPIVPFGLDLGQFPYDTRAHDRPRRLLFVGRLIPDKGLLLAVEAMAVLRDELQRRDVTLSVAGAYFDREYEAQVAEAIAAHGLTDCVHHLGRVPRHALPQLMHEHDVFVFPSLWEEPYGLSLLEAMACGLVVVSTGLGGSAELVDDHVTGLVCPQPEARAFAQTVLQALEPDAHAAMRVAARQRIEAQYQLSQTVDALECDLTALLDRSPG